jgi:class 3 adenylate cyclase
MDDSSQSSARRQATVLFADISGFTALSERMDPEDVREIVNACFAVAEEIILEHGGQVDKYIGDCVMALFGAHQALEDAPRQALNAAIEIRNAIREVSVSRKITQPLNVHIGVNSGLVVTGGVGGTVRRDFSVMGAAVNLAARLQGAATDGQIFVGAATYGSTKDEFEFRDVRPLQLKGFDKPVVVHELMSTEKRTHRGRGARGVSSQLVGRSAELAELHGRIARLAQGVGGIVSVVAENGLGKSRLLAEATTDVPPAVRLLEGRSLSIGGNLRFHPFIDLIRSFASIPENAADDEALGALRSAVAALFRDDASEIFAPIAKLLGLPLSGEDAQSLVGIEGEALEKLIHRAVRKLFERAATVQPLLLVFEDLHWADQSSIALLEPLFELPYASPVLLVLVCRPAYEATSERIIRFVRDKHPLMYGAIELRPLGAADCDALVANLLKTRDVPRKLNEIIISRADGNPFYVEEIVRALLEQGAFTYEKGVIRVSSNQADIEVPGSIQEVILARAERLDEPTRRVLDTAAVIGRRFYRRVLERMLESSNVDLESGLSALIEKQFVLVASSRRTASRKRATLNADVEYVFKHALIQETVYESMLKRSRRDLHDGCARAIEAIFADRPEDAYGMLAYHYARAENLAKTEEFMFLAGEEAARAAASVEALHYFQEAYRIYVLLHGDSAEADKKAIFEHHIASAYFNCGRLGESIEHFDTALSLHGVWVPKTQLASWAKFWLDLGAVLGRMYLTPERRLRSKNPDREKRICTILYNRARAENPTDPRRFFFDTMAATRFMRSHDPSVIEQACGIHATGGAFFAFAGISFPVARRFLAEAAVLARDDRPADHFQINAMGTVIEFHAGDWSQKYDIDDELMSHGLRAGLLWDADVYLGLAAERELRKGNSAPAEAHIATLAEVKGEYGYGFSESNETAMRAFLLLEQRKLEEAAEWMQAYYDLRRDETARVFALSGMAKIQTMAGALEPAAQSLEQARQIIAGAERMAPFYLGAYYNACLMHGVARIEAAGRGAQTREVQRDAKRALAMAAKIARERPEAHRLAGKLHFVLGKADRAFAQWRLAIEQAEILGTRPELGRIYADMARALERDAGKSTRDESAESLRERAQSLFRELGLEWDLVRLDGGSAPGAAASSVARVA